MTGKDNQPSTPGYYWVLDCGGNEMIVLLLDNWEVKRFGVDKPGSVDDYVYWEPVERRSEAQARDGHGRAMVTK